MHLSPSLSTSVYNGLNIKSTVRGEEEKIESLVLTRMWVVGICPLVKEECGQAGCSIWE